MRKWISIAVGTLVALLLIGVVALPFALPLEKIKDFAVEKISEAINREVKIESVSFNIFSGIKLKNLSISNSQGFAKKSFVSADAVELHYAFWPLFKRQIIVKEISLVRPEILIEKSVGGVFNFSDLVKKKAEEGLRGPQKAKKAKRAEKGKEGFSIIVDTFSVKKARITYVDQAAKSTSEIKDANLVLSGITLSGLKPIDLKASAIAVYKEKSIPLSLAGKIKLNFGEQTVDIPSLALNLAGEKADISAKVSNWKTEPSIDFSISSRQLSVDPLLAVFAAAEKPKKAKLKRGELTETISKSTARIPSGLKVNGDIDIDNLAFRKFKADKVKLSLVLSNKQVSADLKEIRIYGGTLSGRAKVNLNQPGLTYTLSNIRLAGFDAAPFSNAMVETFLTSLPDYKDLLNKVYGKLGLSLSLSGAGVEAADIMKNAVGSGSFSLKNGELKRLKTLDAIADKIKAPALKQDLKLSEFSGSFAMANYIINVRDLTLKEADLGIKFNGAIDLNKLEFVPGNRLALRASPASTKELSREFNLFRDDKGWLELDFELAGSLKKPIPLPRIEKPVEKAVGRLKVEIEAKKVEVEEKAKEKVKKTAEKETEKLKEEAKEKLKELIKF